MCDGVSAAMALLSVASTAAGVAGQRRTASKQLAANAKQREIQADEIADAASSRAGERVKQSRDERARLRVAAGEALVGGNSFESLLLDSALQEDLDIAAISKNASNAQRASSARFLSANAVVQNPSFLSNALNIGLSGAQGYAFGRSLKIPTSTSGSK